MSTQQASSTGVHHATEILDSTIDAAGRAGRHDLVRRLSDARRLLVAPTTATTTTAATGAAGIGLAHLRAVTNHTLSALDQLQDTLRFRRSVLTRPGRAEEARAQAQQASDALETLFARSARWQTMLYDHFAAISSDVDYDLHQRMQTVHTDADRKLTHGDPANTFDDLATWLRDQLTQHAHANHDLTVTSARTVSQRAATHLALGQMHIIDPPPAAIPTELPTTLSTTAVTAGTRIGLSSGMNIFLRTYIGFVMFFLLTGFTGVMLPLALGLAPALLMGGLAIIEERKRQISQRRAQAATTIANYITDFTTRISKNSRDLQRQLEQQLRDAYATHLQQAQHTLEKTRDQAHHTLDEHQQTPTLLTQLNTDLQHLTTLHHHATTIIPTELLNTPHTTTRLVLA